MKVKFKKDEGHYFSDDYDYEEEGECPEIEGEDG
jgi:hypothetical protein